jgi:hypothetical protein
MIKSVIRTIRYLTSINIKSAHKESENQEEPEEQPVRKLIL